jgi:hypothetical protein
MERVVAATAMNVVLTRDPKTGKNAPLPDISCADVCGASGTPRTSVSRKNVFAPLQVDEETAKSK